MSGEVRAPGAYRSSYDPLLHDCDLPIRLELYPLGFPLELRTNSTEAESAALDSWGSAERLFERRPVELRVIVEPGSGCSVAPVFRAQGRLLSVVADQHNFGAAELDREFAYLMVSEGVAADPARFRWFFLEALVYTILGQAAVTPLHAACVVKDGKGVLLCGRSGSGKSTLALAAGLRGWTLLSDDGSYLVNGHAARLVTGSRRTFRLRADAPRLFPVLDGREASMHPNGKPTIEVPAAELGVRTIAYCQVEAVVSLRRGGGAPGVERIAEDAVIEELLYAIGRYGDEVGARHCEAITAATDGRTWALTYDSPQQAVQLLDSLVPGGHE